MKKILSAFLLIGFVILISLNSFASKEEMKKIKTEFDSLRDLGSKDSFSHIKGKKYTCDEYKETGGSRGIISYKTELAFETEPYNTEGDSWAGANYLEFSQYRRNNDYALTPNWGCVGAEFGLNYLTDAPYLHVDHEVSRIGNSNRGPCYTFKVRLKSDGLVGIGLNDGEIIQSLKCSEI